MVDFLAGGAFFGTIGFAAGCLYVHAANNKVSERTRSNKKLSTEQLSSILFGLYVGLAVAAIQKSMEVFEAPHGSKLQALLLAFLATLVALIIQYFFLNRTNAGSLSPQSTADALEKLASLQERGLLSQEEFDSQKSRLINHD